MYFVGGLNISNFISGKMYSTMTEKTFSNNESDINHLSYF